jgi:hypothetical protein
MPAVSVRVHDVSEADGPVREYQIGIARLISSLFFLCQQIEEQSGQMSFT